MTETSDSTAVVKKRSHHNRHDLCTTRPSYRQGRKLTAVKVEPNLSIGIVYTVNEESQHLIIRGVPSLSLHKELKNLCMRYGDVKGIHIVTNYAEDEEQFTEVYHAIYQKIQSARFAKHMIDDRAFYGGILHVCYAPELESLTETRQKLMQRSRDVLRRIQRTDASGQKRNIPSDLHESHTNVFAQETSTFTQADGGVIERTFIPNVRGQRSRNTQKNTHPCSPLAHGTNRINVNSSVNLKRNRATRFLPSSLKRVKTDPHNHVGAA